MRVLLIGTDRALLDASSAAARRHARYAEQFDELDIIVFAKGEGKRTQIAENAQVHPTNSSSRLLYGLDAFQLARTLPRPSVISAQDPFETGLAAWALARTMGVPLHIQVHTDFLAPAFTHGSFLNRIRRALAGFVLARADRVRVVSESLKEGIEKKYRLSVPIMVLPIFVDVQKYVHLARTKHPRFKIALLSVGRLEKEKCFTRAIDALKAARDAGHDAGLTIVGSGSEEQHLRAYARSLGLERFVEFAGWQNDLAPYFSTTDLLLVTSEYEGYGRNIIEALAAGIPVLSTDVGIAREAGAMVTQPEHFSEALQQWLSGGPRTGSLASYPYANEEAYIRAWCAEVQATRKDAKGDVSRSR